MGEGKRHINSSSSPPPSPPMLSHSGDLSGHKKVVPLETCGLLYGDVPFGVRTN